MFIYFSNGYLTNLLKKFSKKKCFADCGIDLWASHSVPGNLDDRYTNTLLF